MDGDIAQGSTMTATNHDDQLGWIYPTTLNELNSTFADRFHVSIAVAFKNMVCGRHCIGPTGRIAHHFLATGIQMRYINRSVKQSNLAFVKRCLNKSS